jgi:hypothetical protein
MRLDSGCAVLLRLVTAGGQVLKVILSKGEFQLNEDEREQELESMFRDVSGQPMLIVKL